MIYGYIDLHLHLDGSVSLSSARELARISGVELPADDGELKSALVCRDDCRNLNEYLEKFALPCSLLQSAESIERAVFNLCGELRARGYIYAEIRFAPQKHCECGLTQDEAVLSAIRGLSRSGFFAQLILCCMRDGDDNLEENLETLSLAKKYLGRGVCACDLAGAEALYPNSLYADVFAEARRLCIPFTIHSGEADGAQSIKEALDFGASRIGHGVRAIEDSALLEKLAESKIPLEICPTSNVNTCAFDKISSIPIPAFEKSGVIVTVNSDNMSVSDTDVIKEFERISEAFGYGEEDIVRLLRNAARAAFLPEEERERLAEKIMII